MSEIILDDLDTFMSKLTKKVSWEYPKLQISAKEVEPPKVAKFIDYCLLKSHYLSWKLSLDDYKRYELHLSNEEGNIYGFMDTSLLAMLTEATYDIDKKDKECGFVNYRRIEFLPSTKKFNRLLANKGHAVQRLETIVNVNSNGPNLVSLFQDDLTALVFN